MAGDAPRLIPDAVMRWYRQRRVRRKLSHMIRAARAAGWTTARAIQAADVRHGTVLALAAHVDDEAVGCGGTLCLHQQANDEIHLVYALVDPLQQAVREAEAARAAAQLSARSVTQLRCAPAVEDVALALEPIVRERRPAVTYVPWALDNHEGHLVLNRAVGRLIERGVACGELWCYEVWTPLIPNRLVDITTVLDAKQRLLEVYTSQLAQNDLVSMGLGLSRYRGGSLPGREAVAAEAFLTLSDAAYRQLNEEVARLSPGAPARG